MSVSHSKTCFIKYRCRDSTLDMRICRYLKLVPPIKRQQFLLADVYSVACVQSSVTVGRSSVVAIVDHVPALHNTASINIFVFISSVPSSPLPANRDPSVCQDENRFLAPRFVLDQDMSQCPRNVVLL